MNHINLTNPVVDFFSDLVVNQIGFSGMKTLSLMKESYCITYVD
jgi:hypothetical protein